MSDPRYERWVRELASPASEIAATPDVIDAARRLVALVEAGPEVDDRVIDEAEAVALAIEVDAEEQALDAELVEALAEVAGSYAGLMGQVEADSGLGDAFERSVLLIAAKALAWDARRLVEAIEAIEESGS